jgi:hypothetical protein
MGYSLPIDRCTQTHTPPPTGLLFKLQARQKAQKGSAEALENPPKNVSIISIH